MIGASKRFLFGIGALALLRAAAWAQTVPLVGDAFIAPGTASNFGGTVNVNVGGVAGYQGLFQFDLGSLPPGTTAASVSGASLRLFVNKIGTAGSINVNVATASWSESTVNGLSGVGVGQLVAGPIAVSVANTYISIPVTAQVQAWLNGAPNNGLIVTANPSTTSLFFDSKESTSTSHPAALEIDLSGQPGAIGAPGSPGAPGVTGAPGPTGATGPQGPTGRGRRARRDWSNRSGWSDGRHGGYWSRGPGGRRRSYRCHRTCWPHWCDRSLRSNRPNGRGWRDRTRWPDWKYGPHWKHWPCRPGRRNRPCRPDQQ